MDKNKNQRLRTGLTAVWAIALAALLSLALPAYSQVTIGEDAPPHPFSLLELSTTKKTGGLRLPQLTTLERGHLTQSPEFDLHKTNSAIGLMIYNTDIDCIEFWNGMLWISQCKDGQLILVGSGAGAYCDGDNVILTATVLGGKGPYDFEWYEGGSGSDGDPGTKVYEESGSGNPQNTYSFILNALNSGNVYYAKVTDTDSSQTVWFSFGLSVTLPSPLTVNVTSYDQDQCPSPGSTFMLSVTPSGGKTVTPYTYKWYSNTVDDRSAASEIPGVTRDRYNAPLNPNTTAQDTYYWCEVTDGCGTTDENTTAIHIHLMKVSAVIKNGTQSFDMCSTDAPSHTIEAVPSGGSGNYAYQWQRGKNPDGADRINISGATNPAYTIPAADPGTVWYYWCTVTDNTCKTSASTSADPAANRITQTTYDAPSVYINGWTGTREVCHTSVADPSDTRMEAAGSGHGALVYQWFRYDDAGYTNGTTAPGTSDQTVYYAPASEYGSSYWYRCRITDGCENEAWTTDVLNIRVYEDNLTVDNDPVDATECYDPTGTYPLSVHQPAGGSGTYVYQWYEQNNLDPAPTWTLIPGANQDSYAAPLDIPGSDTDYKCEVTDDCPLTTPVVTAKDMRIRVSVQPAIDWTGQTITETCRSDDPADKIKLEVAVTGGTAPFTYKWYANATDTDFTNAKFITGTESTKNDPADSFEAPVDQAGTITRYWCVVTDDCRTGFPVPLPASVRVYDPLSVTNTPNETALCPGDPTAITLSVTASGGNTNEPYSYGWYRTDTDARPAPGDPAIIGSTDSWYEAYTGTPGTTSWYWCLVTDDCGQQEWAPQVFKITTRPGDIKVDPAAEVDAEVCPQDGGIYPLTVTAGGAGGSYTFQWYIGDQGETGHGLGTPIPGATYETYDVPLDNAGDDYYYWCDATDVTCTDLIARNSLPMRVRTYAFTLYKPDDKVVEGSDIPYSFVYLDETAYATSGSGSYSYQWYETDASIQNPEQAGQGTPVSDPSADTYHLVYTKQGAGNLGTWQYWCDVTDTTCGVTLRTQNKVTVEIK